MTVLLSLSCSTKVETTNCLNQTSATSSKHPVKISISFKAKTIFRLAGPVDFQRPQMVYYQLHTG